MKLRLAIDANEANTAQRVGSNVYAFELIKALEVLLRELPIEANILLSKPPESDLPAERAGWKYSVFGPVKLWTQWALPLHLFQHRTDYDLLFTPSHYAPRISPIPYISAVMDTAYLEFPDQFTVLDRLQLTEWTRYSVRGARHVITISQHAKQSVCDAYKLPSDKVSVIYPAANPSSQSLSEIERVKFFSEHHISRPYVLYVGTLQPRKNLDVLISAFESFSQQLARSYKSRKQPLSTSPNRGAPCLVLAGKVGWLAEPILKRIQESPFRARIITPGYISDAEKRTLYEHALCTTLVGSHEGFGIPPLEAMLYGSIPVVARATSLPEVVGNAGFSIGPGDTKALAQTFREIIELGAKQRAILLKAGREQAAKFSWQKSAAELVKLLAQNV